jgi:hypothetical protein
MNTQYITCSSEWRDFHNLRSERNGDLREKTTVSVETQNFASLRTYPNFRCNRHSALDAESPKKRGLVSRGLRVKPAMTKQWRVESGEWRMESYFSTLNSQLSTFKPTSELFQSNN